MPANLLARKDVVVIFAYAPTGLGHLRVTNALYEGAQRSIEPLLLGSHDRTIGNLHRIASLHPFTRWLMDYAQGGPAEDFVSTVYGTYLRRKTDQLFEQLSTILEQRVLQPKVIVILATHSNLAHQLAAIKDKIAKEKRVKVFLIVQVTDDSPQFMWYVPGADLTFVPSDSTKEQLARYGRQTGKPEIDIRVVAYPVSPRLAQPLTQSKLTTRYKQIDAHLKSTMHVVIPISGAAVGMSYYKQLIEALYGRAEQFVFHVVAKSAPFTKQFLLDMSGRSYVKIYTAEHDREVVEMYEDVYHNNVIAFEVTKPSEQSFKCLLTPKLYGGAIMLFSTPVGRQEYDNLYFLRRHNLLPTESENEKLVELSAKDVALPQKKNAAAVHWRGVRIPDDATKAADFILWGMKHGLFLQMMKWKKTKFHDNNHAHELSPHGVQTFWESVSDFVSKQLDFRS